MLIYLASDHRGFNLKESLKSYLGANGYEVVDGGAFTYDSNDDYPDFVSVIADKVSKNSASLGIAICGSGVGACIVANKYPNIRAGVVNNPDEAYLAKNDDNINILCLGSDLVDDKTAKMSVATWLQTQFSNEERHRRRIRKIQDVEYNVKNTRL